MNSGPITADTATLFKDPETGLLHSIDKAWLWTLLFGPFYFAVKRAWLHAVIFFVFSIFIPGFLNLVYAFTAQRFLRDLYNKKGWIPQDPSVLETTKLISPLNLLLEKNRFAGSGAPKQTPAEPQYPAPTSQPQKPEPVAPAAPSYTPTPVSRPGITTEAQRNLRFNIVFVIGAIIIIAMTSLDIEFSSLLEQVKSLLENN
ncbi:MAG: hypothetical protein HOK97_16495 [Deltaproteobacteria bacterium]|jgi:hypothetical protein|nr:hypothetical protein [Deltaproteobacteria bacterium]MBT6491373.1 hypothetical protein [Deltaproteobacteria bacterium]